MTREQRQQTFAEILAAARAEQAGPSEPMSDEERAMIALASELARTDFSAAYGERAALRRRLLNQHSGNNPRFGHARAWSPPGDKVTMFTNKRRLAMAAAALVVVGILAFVRLSPAMAAPRQEVAGWLQVAGVPDDVIVSLTGASFGAAIRNPDGSIQQINFRDVSTVEEAQAAATFTVKQPTVLPDGLALNTVSISDEGDWVVLTYTNSAGNRMLSLSQRAKALLPGLGRAEVGIGISDQAEGGGGIPMNVVQWQANGISYELSGTYSEAELQTIADTVQ